MSTLLPSGISFAQDEKVDGITILTLGGGNLKNLALTRKCWCQFMDLLESVLTHTRAWSPKQYATSEGMMGKWCV